MPNFESFNRQPQKPDEIRKLREAILNALTSETENIDEDSDKD